MHLFWGYTLAEWASIIAIFGGIGTLIGWIFHVASDKIVEPIKHSVDNLTQSINDFKKDSHEEHREFQERIEKHDKQLIDHETRIKLLEHEREDNNGFN